MDANNNLNVLIVDDSEFSAQCVKSFLDDTKYTVQATCQDAQTALEITKSNQIHIAIIDIVMPYIGGIELTRAMLEAHPDIKVILISSIAGESIVLDAISSGAVDYLQKPFNKEDLINAVEKAENQIGVL